jgi:hypothetical protein
MEWRAANSLGNSLWCFERYSRNSLGQLFHKTKPISRHWGGFYLMSETGDRIKEAVPGGTTNTKGFVKNDRKTYHCRSFLKHTHTHTHTHRHTHTHTRKEFKCSHQAMEQTMFQLDIFFFFVFWDRVSLCSPGCLGTHSVEQAGLELRNLPASASWVLGLKVCATMPGF